MLARLAPVWITMIATLVALVLFIGVSAAALPPAALVA